MRKNGLRLEESEIRIMARMTVRTSSVVTHFVHSGDPNLKAHQKNKDGKEKPQKIKNIVSALKMLTTNFISKKQGKTPSSSLNCSHEKRKKKIFKMTSNRKKHDTRHTRQ